MKPAIYYDRANSLEEPGLFRQWGNASMRERVATLHGPDAEANGRALAASADAVRHLEAVLDQLGKESRFHVAGTVETAARNFLDEVKAGKPHAGPSREELRRVVAGLLTDLDGTYSALAHGMTPVITIGQFTRANHARALIEKPQTQPAQVSA